MTTTEDDALTVGEAKLSVYRFIAGAQCTEEDLENVKIVLRFAALTLSQAAVSAVAKTSIEAHIANTDDEEQKEMLRGVLHACGALCQAAYEYTEASSEKGLN